MDPQGIRLIVRDLYAADPGDQVGRVLQLEKLKSLRPQLADTVSDAATLHLDSALCLMELMVHSEDLPTEAELQLIARLLASVEVDFELRQKELQGRAAPSSGAGWTPVAGTSSSSSEPAPAQESAHQRSRVIPSQGGVADLNLMGDMLLGEILFQQRIVTHDQLTSALRRQLATGQPLGRCMVELGFATRGQIQGSLEVQDRLRGHADAAESEPEPEPETKSGAGAYWARVSDCVLGEILKRLGVVDEERLEAAFHVQRATGVRIGEALVEIGAVDWDQIKTALHVQEQHRRAI